MTRSLNEYTPVGEGEGDIDNVSIEIKIISVSGQSTLELLELLETLGFCAFEVDHHTVLHPAAILLTSILKLKEFFPYCFPLLPRFVRSSFQIRNQTRKLDSILWEI